MASIISNEVTESTLRQLLQKDGYSLSPKKANGETGEDICAERQSERLFIEVIGHKKDPPMRSKDFYESFFRAVSRSRDGVVSCVIAMPSLAKRGLPARARQYGQAWKRIGEAFPELEIWLVDTETPSYERSRWNDWAVG